jgi:PAS domain S-box-containing protein
MPSTSHILIVEDDPVFRNFLTKLLTRKGYTLQTAGEGQKAIRLLDDNTADLVLLDIGLPDMDGIEVLQQIRDRNTDTRVIIMTGNASIDSATEALHKGAYDYVEKPILAKKLLKKIENALKQRKLEKECRHAEQQFQESEQRFRALVENSLVGISIIQNNRYVYKNPNQEKIFGPVTEKPINEILRASHPDDFDKVKAVYESLRNGEVKSAEIEARFYPSGDTSNQADLKWVQCRVSAIKYAGKDAILLNIIDTTEAKQMEQQLIIKNKMLSLGRVAAGIAHEIRNPLTGINSYLYTLDDLCHGETISAEDIQLMQQIVEQVQVAANKIESVIKRVMDFSKPGTPAMVLSDLNASAQAAINLSAVTMRKREIQLRASLSPRIPQCYIDPALIEQVILNLITNAAKSFEKSNDNKIIEITSFSVNNRVFLQVSDSGPGVPPELREKIFDPFFTTREDGSGIGLNIAQRIIADHNGSISLGTSKWGGAEFRIELPVEKRINAR